MTRGVLFDLDGTLIDSRGDLAEAANRALQDRGYPALPEDRIATFVGRGARMLLARCLEAVDPGASVDEPLVLEFLAHYGRIMLDTTAPFPGVVDGLERLQDHGVALAVVTNKPHAPAMEILEGLDLAQYFGFMLGGGRFPKKPAPDMLLIAAGKIGAHPAESIYVGDSDVDVEAAAAAEMTSVWCSWGGFTPDAPDDADVRIDAFDELVRYALTSGGAGARR